MLDYHDNEFNLKEKVGRYIGRANFIIKIQSFTSSAQSIRMSRKFKV